MNALTTPFSIILENLRTTDEAASLIETVDSLLKQVYQVNNTNIVDKFITTIPQSLSQPIKKLMQERQINEQQRNSLDQFLRELETAIKSCIVLHVTISIEPTAQLVQSISKSAKSLYGQTTIIEIDSDPLIIGGAIITYNGIYYDGSLKTKFSNYFSQVEK